jgi:hypothetical protein
MPSSVLSLPTPVILLVHLHILEYPHANKPEYDHNVFEPRVHGLRERTKLLEDVSYFLVGRLEGSARNVCILFALINREFMAADPVYISQCNAIRHGRLSDVSIQVFGNFAA